MKTDWPPHLVERFETERPRKLLALDGGGIRGVLTLEILAEMERQIKGATDAPAAVPQMDAVDQIPNLRRIDAGVATHDVRAKHFGSFLSAK